MLPRVILHNAVSVDGRVEGFTPDMPIHFFVLLRAHSWLNKPQL